MRPMDGHEKECALAAIASRIEKTSGCVRAEWRKLYREVLTAPLFVLPSPETSVPLDCPARPGE